MHAAEGPQRVDRAVSSPLSINHLTGRRRRWWRCDRSRLRAPIPPLGAIARVLPRPRSSREAAGVALHCMKLLLRLANSWSCPARRREHPDVSTPSGGRRHHPSRRHEPIQQLRPNQSGRRREGEQKGEHAHEPKCSSVQNSCVCVYSSRRLGKLVRARSRREHD